MDKPTIVIIEDEEDLLELLEYNLNRAGFETIGFLSTKNVKKLLKEEKIDLMIVDRNLPHIEGSEFVKQLRDSGINIPTIFATAKDADEDIELGFERGGDDYLTKPYNMKELILRIRAILKRTNPTCLAKVEFKDIVLNMQTRKVYVAKDEIDLTKLEFDLLATLIQNKNSVLNREYLLTHVWKDETYFQDKTVNVAINRLKKKIDPQGTKEYIKSVWGIGYTIQ